MDRDFENNRTTSGIDYYGRFQHLRAHGALGVKYLSVEPSEGLSRTVSQDMYQAREGKFWGIFNDVYPFEGDRVSVGFILHVETYRRNNFLWLLSAGGWRGHCIPSLIYCPCHVWQEIAFRHVGMKKEGYMFCAYCVERHGAISLI